MTTTFLPTSASASLQSRSGAASPSKRQRRLIGVQATSVLHLSDPWSIVSAAQKKRSGYSSSPAAGHPLPSPHLLPPQYSSPAPHPPTLHGGRNDAGACLLAHASRRVRERGASPPNSRDNMATPVDRCRARPRGCSRTSWPELRRRRGARAP